MSIPCSLSVFTTDVTTEMCIPFLLSVFTIDVTTDMYIPCSRFANQNFNSRITLIFGYVDKIFRATCWIFMFLVNFGFLLLFAYPLDVLLTASEPWITRLVNYFNDVNAMRQRDVTSLKGANTKGGPQLQFSGCMILDNYLILLVNIQFNNLTEFQTAEGGTKFRQEQRCLPGSSRMFKKKDKTLHVMLIYVRALFNNCFIISTSAQFFLH